MRGGSSQVGLVTSVHVDRVGTDLSSRVSTSCVCLVCDSNISLQVWSSDTERRHTVCNLSGAHLADGARGELVEGLW